MRTTPRREHSPDTRSAPGEVHGGRRHRTPQFLQVGEGALYAPRALLPDALTAVVDFPLATHKTRDPPVPEWTAATTPRTGTRGG